MKVNKLNIEGLINQVNHLITELALVEQDQKAVLEKVSEVYQKSALNLIHYKTLRKHDIRKLQKKLKYLGLSRLGNANSHVKASLLNTKHILECLIDGAPNFNQKAGLSIKNGQKLQNTFAKELLGFRSKGRRVRIMVTQPSEAADHYELVFDMVRNGMNCARINCAHDDSETWLKIINHVNKASKELGRKVKIAMDLAGPKIRTGEILPGPKVKKFRPERDDSGNLIKPALIRLSQDLETFNDDEIDTVPIQTDWLTQLKIGDKIIFTDMRGKVRTLKVIAVYGREVIVSCLETSYIGTNTVFKSDRIGETTVLEMPPIEQSILLKEGEILKVKKTGLGEPALRDDEGKTIKNASISCQVPEVFDRIKVGEPVLFDDGKIEGKIITKNTDDFDVEIVRTKNLGAKLKAEKGINFPNSELQISGLTQKDKEDLKFIAKHADMVNFSFVNSTNDVKELIEVLKDLNAFNQLDIILKIETQSAFDHLTEILLSAMQTKYIGVMIARGDLAVETGWENIAWVQKEILAICDAAHIPVIWATQVFENLAKKGLPSRAEITDATMGIKSDCVMLNKGIYINQAIQLLHKILSDMEKYDEKNDVMLPSLKTLKNEL